MKVVAGLIVTLFLIGAYQPAMAQVEKRELGLHAIGGDISFTKPESIDGTIGFEAKADIGDAAPKIAIQPSISYWKSSNEGVDVSEFAINADAVYDLDMATNFEPFVGAGLGLIFTSVDIEGVNLGGFNDGNGIGLNLFGGARMPLGSMDGFAEARLRFGSSSYDTFAIKAGVMVPLK